MIKATIFTLLQIGLVFHCKAQSIEILPKNDSFTNVVFSSDTMTDIDGNIYSTVKIGNQVWMKENLRVTRFRNGDMILKIDDNRHWIMQNSPALCSYSNGLVEESWKSQLGLLYNGFTIQDKREVCPEGWKVPTDADFYQLIKKAGGPFAAIKLKSKNVDNLVWKQYFYSSLSTDELGFSIVPAGIRKDDFEGISEFAFFYTRKMSSANSFYAFTTNYQSDSFNRTIVSKNHGLSIRCIKE